MTSDGAVPGTATTPARGSLEVADGARPVIVVGAGIAGVSCARALHDAGVPVLVLDRGRRMGGRMAVRTERLATGPHPVDIGASYFTVRDERFATVVEDWRGAGLAEEWTDTFHIASPDGVAGTRTGIMRWRATRGLRSLVEHLADGLDVVAARDVAEVGPDALGVPRVDGEAAAAVVLAMPDPQAVDLLPEDLAADLGLTGGHAWSPTVCVWGLWSRRWWPDLDGVFVEGSPVVSWLADDGRRRGDDAAVLVAHTTAIFTAGRLDNPGSVLGPVLEELPRLLGGPMPKPLWVRAHRWSLALPLHPHDAPFALHGRFGVCGDGWGPRPRVEQAWLSGRDLADALTPRLLAAQAGGEPP
jgi:predicted NAD/FAD-dependent oxidoreductase